MKGLVFGATGQVGRELARLAPDFKFVDRAELELTQASACAELIKAHRPDAVINAAAYTQVDAAEDNLELAMSINRDAPTAMAEAAASVGAALVHISTDYVFDGSGSDPRTEEATPNPLGVYGASKLAGELGVERANGRHAILRTSWVFSAHGSNFVKTMLRLSDTRDTLSVVDDQIGGPTSAQSIARVCVTIATHLCQSDQALGRLHFAGTPSVSWAAFAPEIFQRAGRDMTVVPIPTAEYPTRAARPLNSLLNCQKIKDVLGVAQPNWQDDLEQVLRELEG